MLDELFVYGVRGKCLDWICSYLTHRKQYVRINNKESDMLCINCGVPSGSILGPLWLTYLRKWYCKNIWYFANDSVCWWYKSILSHPNLDDICIQLNLELKKLSRWFQLNKLYLNTKKTNIIIFTSKLSHLKTIPNVRTDKNKTDMVKSSQFLGVIINSSLDWSDHISLVNRKVSKSIGIL